jgi:hypothetical protein
MSDEDKKRVMNQTKEKRRERMVKRAKDWFDKHQGKKGVGSYSGPEIELLSTTDRWLFHQSDMAKQRLVHLDHFTGPRAACSFGLLSARELIEANYGFELEYRLDNLYETPLPKFDDPVWFVVLGAVYHQDDFNFQALSGRGFRATPVFDPLGHSTHQFSVHATQEAIFLEHGRGWTWSGSGNRTGELYAAFVQELELRASGELKLYRIHALSSARIPIAEDQVVISAGFSELDAIMTWLAYTPRQDNLNRRSTKEVAQRCYCAEPLEDLSLVSEQDIATHIKRRDEVQYARDPFVFKRGQITTILWWG